MFELTDVDGITVIELAHGKANAMDLEFCTGMTGLLARLEHEGAAAMVLTARGSIFSAGVDLIRLVEGGQRYVREFVPALVKLARALFTFRRPMVAAVNGHAIAGGCVMACGGDARIMADGGGRIGIPELLVGVPFPAVPLEMVRESVTPAAFRSLVNEGKLLDAAGARDCGLIDEVVHPDTLRSAAIERASRLSRIPAATFEVTKAQMRAPAIARMNTLDAEHADRIRAVWAEPATLEAVRAYIERTFKRSEAARS